jgi:AraC-like DNA-binding protein
MDVLSDVLHHLPVRGTVSGECELRAPWGFVVPKRDEASFQIISRGGCYLVRDGDVLSLASGDLVLFPHGAAYSLVDEPTRDAVHFDALVRAESSVTQRGCRRFVGGAEGATTTLICGQFTFAPGGHHLRAQLPEIIHLRTADDPTVGWLEQSLRFISREARSAEPGAQMAVDRLVDLLFVQALRAWLRPLSSAARPGWLGALADDKLGAALSLLHEAPEKPWTVDALGRAVGMSRSGFAARFAKLVGEPPLRYLMGWRMTLAAQRLRVDSSVSVSEIARSVGYESEAAFSTIFKRYYNAPPAAWRREQA